MKLYVVTADTHDCGYGAEISLFGIYDNAEEARKRKESLEKSYGYKVVITETSLNAICEQYLGGYVE